MARYKITHLNYLTAGKKHAFINVDAALEYDQPTKVKILDAEQNKLSVITLDQGNIEYIDGEYIEKESGDPLSLEKHSQTIVLREDQQHIKNIEAQDKSAILLKTSDDVQEAVKQLKEFQAQMSAVTNLTFELETEQNSSKNILHQEDGSMAVLPMYDIRNLAVKSSNKKKMMNRLYNTDKHVDLYAPTMLSGPMKFCEADGYSYMLLEPTRSTPQMLYAHVNDNEDDSYYMQVLSGCMKTYAYPPLVLLNHYAIEEGQISKPASSYAELFQMVGAETSAAMLQLFSPKYNYDNLQYNYILDFDQNSTSLNYDTGDIYSANINIAKNIYNAMYTIDMDNADTIENTREYFTIGSMNNTVFLTFIDDIKQEALTHNAAPEAGIVNVKMQKKQSVKTYYVDENGKAIR